MTKGVIFSREQLIEAEYYGLPHEVALLREQIEGVDEKLRQIAPHITDAMEQSSETWHDNAPADALFGEVRILDERRGKLIAAKRKLHVVEYPEPDFAKVAIGTRALCEIMGDAFEIDVVGNLPIFHPDDGDVETGSVDAPMPRSLLGAEEGHIVAATIGERVVEISVLGVDQRAQRAFYTSSES